MDKGNSMRNPALSGSRQPYEGRSGLDFNRISFGVSEVRVINQTFQCVVEAVMDDAHDLCRVAVQTEMPIQEADTLRSSVVGLKRTALDTLRGIMAGIADRIEFVPARIFPDDDGYRLELKTRCDAPEGGCAVRVRVVMPLNPAIPLKEAVENNRSRAARSMAEAVEALARYAG